MPVEPVTSGTTLLVSRASGVSGDKGNFQSQDAAISGDGQTVVFDSFASNLSIADDDVFPDVYARNLASNTTRPVSRASGQASVTGNGHPVFPTVSEEGRYVAFHTQASNLHSNDPDTVLDHASFSAVVPTDDEDARSRWRRAAPGCCPRSRIEALRASTVHCQIGQVRCVRPFPPR